MTITGPVITRAIIAAGPTLQGPLWYKIASAVGLSVATWAVSPINVNLVGTVVGSVGTGKVTGKLYVPPTSLPISSCMYSSGLQGPLAGLMAIAVGIGVCNALNSSASYMGLSVGAIGVDNSKVKFTNAPTLIGILNANFQAAGVGGPESVNLSSGIGSGVAKIVLNGIGTGEVTGVPGPSPGIGTSQSSLR